MKPINSTLIKYILVNGKEQRSNKGEEEKERQGGRDRGEEKGTIFEGSLLVMYSERIFALYFVKLFS